MRPRIPTVPDDCSSTAPLRKGMLLGAAQFKGSPAQGELSAKLTEGS